MKVVSRKNPRQDRVKELRKKTRLPASAPGAHMAVTDNLSSTEHKIRKEIAVMKKCKHPNVVRLLEVIDDKTFKVTMNAPTADFPQRLGYSAFAVIPEGWWQVVAHQTNLLLDDT